MTTTTARVILVDWDEAFARDVTQRHKASATIEHVMSAPQLREALLAAPVPAAILIDIDSFRLNEGSPLAQILRGFEWVQIVLLTGSSELSLDLDEALTDVVLARKGGDLKKVIRRIVQATQADAYEGNYGLDEPTTVTDQESLDDEVAASTGKQLVTYRQLIDLQRQATMGRLASNIGHELNNINSVLIGATDELGRLLRSHGHEGHDVLTDLQWIHQNMKTYAEHLLRVARTPRRVVEMLDLRRTTELTLRGLEALGKTKYIGVEASLGEESIFVRISRMHLEHVLTNLVSVAADAVLDTQATIRRISISLEHFPDKERVMLVVQDSAGPEHGAYIDRCLSGEVNELRALDLAIAKRIVDANGGILYAERADERGNKICAEFPTEFAAEVTSPVLYTVEEIEARDSGGFAKTKEHGRTRLSWGAN